MSHLKATPYCFCLSTLIDGVFNGVHVVEAGPLPCPSSWEGNFSFIINRSPPYFSMESPWTVLT
eukprot:11506828-Ditylum_brightwellii.AAC.1